LLHSPRKKTSIKGLWKDFEVYDEDFTDARMAIFKDANNWQE
jgi:hypothetical protein